MAGSIDLAVAKQALAFAELTGGVKFKSGVPDAFRKKRAEASSIGGGDGDATRGQGVASPSGRDGDARATNASGSGSKSKSKRAAKKKRSSDARGGGGGGGGGRGSWTSSKQTHITPLRLRGRATGAEETVGLSSIAVLPQSRLFVVGADDGAVKICR
jgi:hypothetical protein